MKNKDLIFRGLQQTEVVSALARRDPATRRMVTNAIGQYGLAPVLVELGTLEPVLECTGDDALTRSALADPAQVSPERLCDQLLPLTPTSMAWDLVPLPVAIAAILKRSLEVMQQAETERKDADEAAAASNPSVAVHVEPDEDDVSGDDEGLLDTGFIDQLDEEGEGEDEERPSSSGSVLPSGSPVIVRAFSEKLREELSLLFFSHDDALPVPTRSDASRIQGLEVDSVCIGLLSSLLQLLERSPREDDEEGDHFEALVVDHSFLVSAMVSEWIDTLLGVTRSVASPPPSDGPAVEQVPDL